MKSMLIKNGHIVTASDQFRGDILIQGGKIAAIGRNLKVQTDEVIDATGKYIFPGGIDAHIHMEVPCNDGSISAGYNTDSIAAAVGGTTTILDYVLQENGRSLEESVSHWSEKAKQSAIDYGFHLIITQPNDKTFNELKLLVEQGITSFKLFMANDIAMTDKDLFRFMSEFKKLGCTACIHAENKEIIAALQEQYISQGSISPIYHAKSRPEHTEVEAINRAIILSELTGCLTLIAHISTAKGLELVQEAKARGIHVLGESCPHYLLLSEDRYNLEGHESAKYVLSPPLRNLENFKGLWRGVLNGAVDIISSDHNGFNYSTHKQLGKEDFRKIPNGAPGIEHRFGLIYHHGMERGMDLSRFVELVSTNPAKIFGIYPQKGTIAPGSDADLVLFNPEVEHVITSENQYQKSDYTPYEQTKLKGKVDIVLLRGERIVHQGKFVGTLGKGNYLKRAIQ
ncbi:dihydropyrimidinase [Desulfosporosinus sp. Sb-LF]|uniref:dihydropyrimidinase n=1 Tax=Desulfosporosinus sp. Sb-LF TaxID=2560027 RepID=UPI00107F9714|nr:dihydropyrimidinase [Desulfosporosinus sp. Sb-LF]TGE32030.1 dihydropyrimidinase [Desulfosporosinus sp. Sb-LF]